MPLFDLKFLTEFAAGGVGTSISGISAGALADGMGCLGVTIGRTELMFQVPTAAISEVARTLLLAGADEHSQRPS